MRKSFNRIVLAACVACSFSATGAQGSDFEALLADVNFAPVEEPVQTVAPPSSSDLVEQVIDVPPVPEAEAFQAATEELPAAQSTPADTETAPAAPPAPAQVAEPAAEQIAEPVETPPAPLTDEGQLASTPADETADLPAPEADQVPPPVMNNAMADEAHAAPAAAQPAAACNQCNTCQSKSCGCKQHHLGHKLAGRVHHQCNPYTQPQLPTSTFYQYWRSNACYTNVWDGYRNRCPHDIDLSIHEPLFGKCNKCNKCNSCGVYPAGTANCRSGNCGPLPHAWGKGNCDTCDGK